MASLPISRNDCSECAPRHDQNPDNVTTSVGLAGRSGAGRPALRRRRHGGRGRGRPDVVEGNIFRFEEYSPDGLFFVDGELTMDLLASPITVKGDLAFRDGEREGPIVVDVTVDLSTSPVSYGGTITVDGEAIDVASLE